MNIILTQEDTDLLYKRLAVSHKLAVVLSDGVMEKYHEMITQAITQTVGQLGSSKMKLEGFDNDVFKSELTEGLNNCLNNKELVEEYGELWIAQEDTLVQAMEAIATIMMLNLLKEALMGGV